MLPLLLLLLLLSAISHCLLFPQVSGDIRLLRFMEGYVLR
jgi:hypothetical protein